MAKVQIKSEKLTPFGGFFPIMEPSPHTLSSAHPSRILFLQLNQFLLKTEDIHPPKTGISVHFSGSLV